MRLHRSLNLHLLIGSVVFFSPFILGQQCEKIVSGCEECIQALDCEWCSHPNLNKDAKRCRKKGSRSANEPLCKNEFLESAKSFQNTNKSIPLGEKIHISPQVITVHPRVNEQITIELTYKEEKNKKLDLYYLLDVSKTMETNKNTVIAQSNTLQADLQEITKDLQMGFGTFIDKPVVPFSDSAQLTKKEDQRPYAFNNDLRLTNQLNDFKRALQKATTRENQDVPEGVLDALMQVVVCDKLIGWRNGSQKLIVVATDDLFHIAGDGKLGGVIIPNNMECHINETSRIYEKATEYDYPSVGQIKHVVGKLGVYVIFAIVPKKDTSKNNNENVLNHYKELEKQIKSVRVAQLESNSENIIKIITEIYQSISAKVELYQPQETRTLDEDILKVSYQVQCKPGQGFVEGNSCDNVKPEDEIKFKIFLTLIKCPNLKKTRVVFSTFDLKALEQLVVHMDFRNCECQCSRDYNNFADKRYTAEANVQCNTLNQSLGMKCGLCDCKEGFLGSNCECNSAFSSSVNDNSTCIYKNEKQLCRGRGDCKCSRCNCINSVRYDGNQCENDNSPCIDEGTSVVCSENGNCVDGPNGMRVCKCKEWYEGERCGCRKDEKKYCTSPNDPSGLECSGNGKCACQNTVKEWSCLCNEGSTGLYCEKTDTGTSSTFSSQCEDKRLIECLKASLELSEENMVKKNQPGFSDCNERPQSDRPVQTANCTQLGRLKDIPACSSKEEGDVISFYDVSVVEFLNKKWTCKLKYNETCDTTFSFEYQKGSKRNELKVEVVAISRSLCAEPVALLTYIFAVVGSILAIGILTLLLWKLLTMWHDRAEFQKFEKERAAARWDTGENPLYNTPMSQFENPAYRN